MGILAEWKKSKDLQKVCEHVKAVKPRMLSTVDMKGKRAGVFARPTVFISPFGPFLQMRTRTYFKCESEELYILTAFSPFLIQPSLTATMWEIDMEKLKRMYKLDEPVCNLCDLVDPRKDEELSIGKIFIDMENYVSAVVDKILGREKRFTVWN